MALAVLTFGLEARDEIFWMLDLVHLLTLSKLTGWTFILSLQSKRWWFCCESQTLAQEATLESVVCTEIRMFWLPVQMWWPSEACIDRWEEKVSLFYPSTSTFCADIVQQLQLVLSSIRHRSLFIWFVVSEYYPFLFHFVQCCEDLVEFWLNIYVGIHSKSRKSFPRSKSCIRSRIEFTQIRNGASWLAVYTFSKKLTTARLLTSTLVDTRLTKVTLTFYWKRHLMCITHVWPTSPLHVD